MLKNISINVVSNEANIRNTFGAGNPTDRFFFFFFGGGEKNADSIFFLLQNSRLPQLQTHDFHKYRQKHKL